MTAKDIKANVENIKKVGRKIRWDRVASLAATGAVIISLVTTGVNALKTQNAKVEAINYLSTLDEMDAISEDNLLDGYVVNEYSRINGESTKYEMTPKACINYMHDYIRVLDKASELGFDTDKKLVQDVNEAQDNLDKYMKNGMFDLEKVEQLLDDIKEGKGNKTEYAMINDFVVNEAYDFAEVYSNVMKRAMKENLAGFVKREFGEDCKGEDITLSIETDNDGPRCSLSTGEHTYDFGSPAYEFGRVWTITDHLTHEEIDTLSGLKESTAAGRAGIRLSGMIKDYGKQTGFIFTSGDIPDKDFFDRVEELQSNDPNYTAPSRGRSK